MRAVVPLNHRTCPSPTWVDAAGRGYAPWTETASGADVSADATRGAVGFHFKAPKRVRVAAGPLREGDSVTLWPKHARRGADAAAAERVRFEAELRAAAAARASVPGAGLEGETAAQTTARIERAYRAALLPLDEVSSLDFRVEEVYTVPTRAAERETFGRLGAAFGAASEREPSAALCSADTGACVLRLVDPNWSDVAVVIGAGAAARAVDRSAPRAPARPAAPRTAAAAADPAAGTDKRT